MSCLIRTPADHALFAGPRRFSQLTTSFLASESLGIPHTPFLTSFRFTYVLVARYTLVYPHYFYHLLFLLFFSSMSMNPLPVYSPGYFQGGSPKIIAGGIQQRDNPLIRQCVDATIPQSRFTLSISPFSTTSFGRPLSLISCLATVLPCGEYRIRTDDPLLAKQVL